MTACFVRVKGRKRAAPPPSSSPLFPKGPVIPIGTKWREESLSFTSRPKPSGFSPHLSIAITRGKKFKEQKEWR